MPRGQQVLPGIFLRSGGPCFSSRILPLEKAYLKYFAVSVKKCIHADINLRYERGREIRRAVPVAAYRGRRAVLARLRRRRTMRYVTTCAKAGHVRH